MARIVLIVAEPALAATGAPVVVRLAGGGARAYTHLGRTDWLAGIQEIPRFETSVGFDQAGFTGGAVPQTADIRWTPAVTARLSMLAAYYWPKAPVTIYVGDDAAGPIGAGALRLRGTVAGVVAEDGGLRITLTDLSGTLATPVAPGTFAGTGGLEGGADAEGRVKRRGWGLLFNIEGRVLDQANNIYEFGDPAFAWKTFLALKDKGREGGRVLVEWAGSAAATLAALRVAACPPGGGAVAPSIAAAKWHRQPSGPLTADVEGEIGTGYVQTAPEIAARIAATHGLAIPDVAAAAAVRGGAAGLLIEDGSETAAAALDRLLLRVSIGWLLRGDGTIALKPLAIGAPVRTLRSDRVQRVTTLQPVSELAIDYRRNHRIHGAAEVAAAITSTDVSYADGTPIDTLQPAVAGADRTADTPTGVAVAAGLNEDGTVQPGRVDTLAIQPDSVSETDAIQTAQATAGAGAAPSSEREVEILRYAFAVDVPAKLVVRMTTRHRYAAAADYGAHVALDGQLIAQSFAGIGEATATGVQEGLRLVEPGTHTLVGYWRGSAGVTMEQGTMIVQIFKR